MGEGEGLTERDLASRVISEADWTSVFITSQFYAAIEPNGGALPLFRSDHASSPSDVAWDAIINNNSTDHLTTTLRPGTRPA